MVRVREEGRGGTRRHLQYTDTLTHLELEWSESGKRGEGALVDTCTDTWTHLELEWSESGKRGEGALVDRSQKA